MAKSDLSASLLVAMPQLLDPNFKRSVVLLVHHDDESSFGLVLNRDVDFLTRDLCASLELEWHGDPAANLSWGGPVEVNTGWLLFEDAPGLFEDARGLLDDEPGPVEDTPRSGRGTVLDRLDPAGLDVSEVIPGLRFAGSLDVLRNLAEGPPVGMRIFLGYAGWGPGQLQAELIEGAWLLAPLGLEIVFDVECDRMWEHVVRSLGVDPATLIPTHGVH